MRSLLPVMLCAALVPGLAAAQTTAVTVQAGTGNESTTILSGETTAVTVQVGEENTAATALSGTHNVSVISQWGSSEMMSHTLSGTNTGLFTQQIDTHRVGAPTTSTVRVGGNSRVSVTIRSDIK